MRVAGTLGMALSALIVACGGGDSLLLPGAGEPASVTLLQGDQQNGRVGEALPQALVAAVADASGRPVEGATVVFALNDPAPGATVDPETATTNADGSASTRIVLGTRPGPQTGVVRALGADGRATATTGFTLTALSESANGIRALGGEDQSGRVGTMLANPLLVEVADAFGNPIEGVEVAWTAEGGGSVSAATTATGQDGRTSVERTLGATAGTQRTLATVNGLAGSPVAFVHTATAGAASSVTIVSGDDQTGPVSTELPLQLVIEVRDAQSNPVSGVAVTWVIGAGGGGVTPATSSTDPAGRTVAAWTLGNTPGANTVSAVASGIGVAEFSATATGGAPARLSVSTQPSSSAVSGVPLGQQPVIQLLDAQGSEARQSGVEVVVSIASGGGTLVGTTRRTTDGVGRATFTDLVLRGSPGARTLRFSSANFAAVTSTPIALTAAPTVTTITSDAPDPSRAGDQITVQFTVTSASGTPTGSVRVLDGSDSCSGTLSSGGGSCQLRLTTVGSRTLTADYAASGGFAASSDTEVHAVEAAPAPVLAVAQQPSSQATAGAQLTQQPIIQLRSGDGADLTTSGVAVSVAIGSGGGTLSGATTRTTDGQGRAVFTDLAINGDPGQRTLAFTASGYTSATSATIDVQPAAPSASTSTVTASPATIPAGGSSTITVTVRDAGGTPLAGRTVTLDSSGAGNSIAPASAASAGDGTATFAFSSTVAEAKTIAATADGTALGGVQVTVE